MVVWVVSLLLRRGGPTFWPTSGEDREGGTQGLSRRRGWGNVSVVYRHKGVVWWWKRLPLPADDLLEACFGCFLRKKEEIAAKQNVPWAALPSASRPRPCRPGAGLCLSVFVQ